MARQQPCLLDILYRIHSAWSLDPSDYDKTMLWAAFCIGFFEVMRAGEFTCPSKDAFTPEMLTPQDIAVDSHVSPTRLSVHLKCSKVDPFGVGCRPVRRILKRGVQGTTWPLGHDEGEGAGELLHYG